MHAMRHAIGIAAAVLAAAPANSHAQWTTVYDQMYLQAPHNWRFRQDFPAADRLFNAFDYGHAILSETLWGRPEAGPDALEVDEYNRLTREILLSPPRLPLAERAIAPRFSRLAPEIKAMFEWAHILHRQLYDVLADPRLAWPAKDAEIAELVRVYKARTDLAFSSRPKTMALMQEQPYSLAFRQKYPKFNGLIWAYHWMQMGLYEPLVTATTREGQQAGVAEALARFRLMLVDPPRTLPYVMPMTPAIAPSFAARYPEASIIFDNLHSLHDVVSDILANPVVPRDGKRHALLVAAAAYRDDTTEVMTVDGWKRMAGHMGLDNMGGAVLGNLGALPTPSVTRGFVMQHDKDGNMIGVHAGHVMPAAPADTAKPPSADEHAMHRPAAAVAAPAPTPDEHAAHAMPRPAPADSAFAAGQARGATVMGVDQYSSQHVFEELKDGGRIVLVRDPADTAGVATIRAHLRDITASFTQGDFSAPFATHAQVVPGTAVMEARRSRIRYAMKERTGGGEVRITTTDPAALRAVRQFLAFQRKDHRAPASVHEQMHKPD